jgi:hypothetical protein
MAKEYIVMKDGTELKTYKSLPAAKALAEKEGAEVYADGECVYSAAVNPVVPAVTPTVEEKTELQKITSDKYVLLRKMNVRKAPSLTAQKLDVLEKGTVIEVEKKVDDWLHLTDGTFIYYEGGKNARKA